MKYDSYLKARLTNHMVASVFCCITMFSFIILNNYTKSLGETLVKLNTIAAKKQILQNNAVKISQTMKRINDTYNINVDASPPSGLILKRVDDLQKNLTGALVKYTDIKKDTGSINLPLTINYKKNYNEIVDSIGTIEKMYYPFFRFSRVIFTVDADGIVNCLIDGVLYTPDVATAKRS